MKKFIVLSFGLLLGFNYPVSADTRSKMDEQSRAYQNWYALL